MSNKDSTISYADSSAFVRRSIPAILPESGGALVLDAPSGSGRNALLLQSLGCTVVCADKDKQSLSSALFSAASCEKGCVLPVQIDFELDNWPFNFPIFDIVINVHFVSEPLWARLIDSLKVGGFLLIETYENRGENYLELPKKGHLQELFKDQFEFLTYEEKSAGPPSSGTVTVKMLARKTTTR